MFRAMIGPTTSIVGGKPCESRCRASGEYLFYAAQRSERMARVPYVARDELDAEGQEIYDRIRRDRNAPASRLWRCRGIGSSIPAGSRRYPRSGLGPG